MKKRLYSIYILILIVTILLAILFIGNKKDKNSASSEISTESSSEQTVIQEPKFYKVTGQQYILGDMTICSISEYNIDDNSFSEDIDSYVAIFPIDLANILKETKDTLYFKTIPETPTNEEKNNLFDKLYLLNLAYLLPDNSKLKDMSHLDVSNIPEYEKQLENIDLMKVKSDISLYLNDCKIIRSYECFDKELNNLGSLDCNQIKEYLDTLNTTEMEDYKKNEKSAIKLTEKEYNISTFEISTAENEIYYKSLDGLTINNDTKDNYYIKRIDYIDPGLEYIEYDTKNPIYSYVDFSSSIYADCIENNTVLFSKSLEGNDQNAYAVNLFCIYKASADDILNITSNSSEYSQTYLIGNFIEELETNGKFTDDVYNISNLYNNTPYKIELKSKDSSIILESNEVINIEDYSKYDTFEVIRIDK